MTIGKYRIHEVAKDFGEGSKVVLTLCEKYFDDVKNHMTTLTENELDLVFEWFTANNQVENFDEYIEKMGKSKPQTETVQLVDETQQEIAAAVNVANAGNVGNADIIANRGDVKNTAKQNENENGTVASTLQSGTQEQAKQERKPAAQQTPFNQKPAQTKIPGEKPQLNVETRVVDTRSVQVDLSKYDERVDKLVPDSLKNTGKQMQKFKKNNNRNQYGKPFGKKNNEVDEAEKLRRKLELERQKKARQKVLIPDEISVSELALRMKLNVNELVKALVKLGVMASASQVIDFETAAIVADELEFKVEREIVMTIEDKLIDDSEDKDEDLKPREPIVVVMGHVDHGKTSILDAIRGGNVAAGEAGGITQHIGAYRVAIEGKRITFLDTPGHAAFTSMRARGAQVTDIAILVVAADDGIMPQTIEAINHAKAAGVAIIVAINKMDKDGANTDRIKQQLTEYELIPEDWGGDTVCVPVSALTKMGINTLLEMVILTADMRELKANPARPARGTVIEAKLDKSRGPVATLIVQNGTLKSGDLLIAGTSVGRVRAMTNDNGKKIEKAGPSVPVEIIGLEEVPSAGDLFHVVQDERMARALADQRKQNERDARYKDNSKITLDDLFSQIKQGEVKDLNIIIKADVNGSIEALKDSLEKISNAEVRVRVIHSSVGAVNESDVILAGASKAIIVGFNVRPNAAAQELAERDGIDMRMYRVIYDCVDEITAAMKGLLAPMYKEEVLGHAEVRRTFKVSGIGTIAGCYVTQGKIARNCDIRLVRDGIIVAQESISSLKRFKDDAKEVAQNYECGISLEKFNDIKEGDVFECFTMVEIER